MNNKEIKILFVRPSKSSFIERDLAILKKHFEVKVLDANFSTNGLKNALVTILKMIREAIWANLVFVWFADIHASFAVFFAKIFQKKSIVIVGGYEVAKIQEIKYGLARHSLSVLMVKYILNQADRVLVVDEALKKDAILNFKVKGENIQTLPTGFDYEKFQPRKEKENLVLTVAICSDWERIQLKGIDVFLRSARFLPDIKFLVIGISGETEGMLRKIAPQNVEFISFIPTDELISYYQKAKVYCQLSMREGLPNALCEAMLCECVPVGADVQGVRTAIGDSGFLIPYGDETSTAEAIKKALNEPVKGKLARERVKKMFSIENREREFMRIIYNLISSEKNFNTKK